MDHTILDSVIKITSQRDVDSLEYGLVATLAEMLSAESIAIYKLVDDGIKIILEETVRLDMKQNDDHSDDLEWTEGPKQICNDQDIQDCMDSGQPVRFSQKEQLTRIILPIACDSKVVAALNIQSETDLNPTLKVLEGMIKVYENYLYILNESERDKLTGLYNRRTFDKKLDRLLQIQRNKQIYLIEGSKNQEKRTIKPYSETWLAIIDVDNFKQINDKYGHVFGDGVLLLLAHKMKLCFRQTDYLFRFGGEEFVVILEPNQRQHAYDTLDRFRDAIATHNFPLVGHVTVSIGYARITDTDYPPAILHSADKALYHAKENGRNRIYNYETLVADGAVQATRMGANILG
ncbi:GGDEF domain-containing protein [Aliikangiella coralliicola]|uniref:diguanylate cyclase n=1 Tax=Aliikangiella coralliicola TaxID=2592383 RepID=A0A545UHW9_9GAMM|nr:GGDEF domain-containing protein [Aliikangiella coralliicola]TQV89067.1 GGDEF domain-containing protein [Aliikangiella coralliicola]